MSVGPPGQRQGCFLLVHRDVLPQVVRADVNPGDVMHSPIHDRIGTHPGSKPLMTALLRILEAKHRRRGAITDVPAILAEPCTGQARGSGVSVFR